MQLLPVSHTSGNDPYETRTESTSGRDNRDFMKLLTESLSVKPAEVTPDLDTYTSPSTSGRAPDTGIPLSPDEPQDNLAVAEAPYTEPVEPSRPKGADTPVEEIRLTDNELHDVIKELREQGADDDTLSRVAALLGNPGGTPVTEVVKAVANVSAAKLTDGDLQRIGSLADRLDATGQLKTSLLEDLKGGRTGQAMARFTEALNKAMGENSSQKISADKNELLALGKALKLDPKTMEKLEKAFGSKESKTLTMADFKELVTPMELDMAEQGKQQEKVAGLLEKALKPAVDKARNRLQKEAEAAGAVDRRTEQSETLIRDTVTRPGLAQTAATKEAGEPKDGKGGKDGKEVKEVKEVKDVKETNSSAAEKSDPRTSKTAGASDSESTAGQEDTPQDTQDTQDTQDKQGTQNTQNTKDGKGGKDGKSDAFASTDAAKKALDDKAKGAENSKQPNQSNQAEQATTKEDPWAALLQRLDVKAEAPTRAVVTEQPVSSPVSVAQAANAMGNRAGNLGNLGNAQQAARVLSQVEQGMYSALTDGTKKLTLNLNPVELGAVSVVLSLRNGEVSAILRPERSDTAAMLAQQVDALRTNLEQQGIKVDKVDVQTPQQQNQNNSWQGAEQHNASQEQQARQEALERMRRVHRMRDAEPQTFSSSAQAMRHAARPNAASGAINVVA